MNVKKRQKSKQNELLKVLNYYRVSMLLIVLFITAVSIGISYFSLNIFQAQTTIKIYTDREKVPKDFMSLALGLNSNNVDHEIDMLRSRWIATKALDNLRLGTRYYENRFLKKFELYKDSPFVVTSEFIAPHIYGSEFIIEPISKERFRLILEPTFIEFLKYKFKYYIDGANLENKIVQYNQGHSYGEVISTPWFHISIQKVHQLHDRKYMFSVVPNESMYKFISKQLQVSALSKKSIVVLLSFNDEVALRAKEIVNSIANAYLEENLHVKTEGANKTLYFLDMQLEAINKTLQSSAENLQKYKASNVVINVAKKAQLTAEKLSTLESER